MGWTTTAEEGVVVLVDVDFVFFSDDRRTGVEGSLDVSEEETSVEESLSICIAWGGRVVVEGEINSMRTWDNDSGADDLLDLVRPSVTTGVLAGCLDVQNEFSVP